MALFDLFRRKKKDRPEDEVPVETTGAPPVDEPAAPAPTDVEERVEPAAAPPAPSAEAVEAARETAEARAEAERAAAAQAEETRRALEERRAQEAEAARAREADERRRAAETTAQEAAERPAQEQHEPRPAEDEAQIAEAARQAALLDAEDAPEVRSERARVADLLASVGPELRTRRIVDLLGVTFGRLAPAGEWGATTLAFRPARGRVLIQVGTDGPEGGREGAAAWKPVASFVEILIQELQRSMYEPASGTWIDGRIVFRFDGPREDHRGRPLPPQADVRVNYRDEPAFGADVAPYAAEEAADFLTRFPRSPGHVPAWLAERARRGGFRG